MKSCRLVGVREKGLLGLGDQFAEIWNFWYFMRWCYA